MIQEDIELRKFKLHVNYVLRKNFYENRIVKCCPMCGGVHYIKHGLYKGIQRYKCKDCNKTFSKTTNSYKIHLYSNLTTLY